MDYYDFSKQGGLWKIQNYANQDGPRCFYSWNYCMGVEQICLKPKNPSFVTLFSCGAMPSLFTKHVLWQR